MLKKIILVLWAISLPCLLSAQNEVNSDNPGSTYTPRLNPISPTSYEFIKYGDIPISEYSGVANISIPIYNIKANGLDIPISLSYHSAGIRVAEEASWVGLGWNINYAGGITQIVNGMDDFGTYKSRFKIDASIFDTPEIPNGAFDNCSTIFVPTDEFSVNESQSIPYQYLNGYQDSEPDIFKFSFLQWTGEFLLDWESGNYVCLTDKNIQINPLNNINGRPGAFLIKVPEGHTFRFELKEETQIDRQSTIITENPDARNNPTGPDMNGEISSRNYKLTLITTNQKESIEFDYILSDEVVNLPSVNVSREFNENQVPVTQDALDLVRKNFPGSIEYTNYVVTGQKLAYLSEIRSKRAVIKFNSSTNRTDLNNARRLDSISIRTPDNDEYAKFNFKYDYFNGHADGTNIDNHLQYLNLLKSDQELTQRLKLLSVQRVGEPEHSFDYDNTALPKKTSLATDYWGFYNGFDANSSLFPNLYRFGLNYNTGQFNNKSADLDYAKAASLSAINYPTGGKTVFNYELNYFDNYFAPSFDQSSNFNPGSTFHLAVNDNNEPNDDSFEVVRLPQNGGHFSGQYAISGPCSALDYDADNVWIKIIKIKEEIAQVWDQQPWQIGSIVQDPSTYEWEQKYFFASGEMSASNFSRFEDIEFTENSPGLLVFWAGLADGCGQQNSAGEAGFAALDLDYTLFGEGSSDQTDLSVGSNGAGLRVESVVDYIDQNNSKALKTLYEYEGGKLMSPLIFLDQYDTKAEYVYSYIPPNNSQSVCMSPEWYGTTTRLTTSSIIPYSTSASGSYVGYDKVSKIRMNTNNDLMDNGKIVTEFINNPDEGAINGIGQGIFTSVPLTKSYPINGLIKSTTAYDKFGNVINRSENSWVSSSNLCFYGMKSKWKEQKWRGYNCVSIYNQHYTLGFYPIRQIESLQLSQTNYQYDGTEVLSTSTGYVYNGKNEVASRTYVDSEGDSYETHYYYPYDIDGFFMT